jgi:hypothetical protein
MGKLEAIVIACIATATHGCGSSSIAGCDPPSRDFTIDAELTEGELTSVKNDYGFDSRDDIDCETVCSFAHDRDEGWQVSDVSSCTLDVTPEGNMDIDAIAASIECEGRAIEYFCEGRRPLGHVELEHTTTGLAEHLAHCAHLEAAAVTAFDDLVAALSSWHAPAPLVDRCRRARAQEVEHAAAVAALALRRGASVTAPCRSPRELSPLAVALDNAVEGCVHEAWAALRARWVAAHACEPELRELYSQLADDELEHAQLSWDLHAWLLGQLDASARVGVETALSCALARLPQLAAEQAVTLPGELGLPDAETFRALAHDFCAKLAA